jgi:hypothetical protein
MIQLSVDGRPDRMGRGELACIRPTIATKQTYASVGQLRVRLGPGIGVRDPYDVVTLRVPPECQGAARALGIHGCRVQIDVQWLEFQVIEGLLLRLEVLGWGGHPVVGLIEQIED